MLILFAGDEGPRETLRFIEDKISLGLFSWEIGSEEIQWSSGMFELFGFAPRSLTPTISLVQAMTFPADRRQQEFFDRLGSQAVSLEREFRIVWRNGRMRWLQSKAEILMGEGDVPRRVIGVCIDTTLIHEARGRAEVDQIRHSKAFEAAGVVVWTADPKGHLIDIRNHDSSDQAKPLNQVFLDLIHEGDRGAVNDAWERSLEDKVPFSVHYRLRQTTGEYRWHRSQALPLRDGAGGVAEWIGVLFDVDEYIGSVAGVKLGQQLTGAQIRGGRGILNWSIKDLSDASKVSPSTIRRLEEIDGHSGDDIVALSAIGDALNLGGVEFQFTAKGKPAVRPK